MGDRVIIARTGYLSNYLTLLQMKAFVGIEIDVVDNDASGSHEGLKVPIRSFRAIQPPRAGMALPAPFLPLHSIFFSGS
jgi:hypothetical protein